LSAFHPQAEVDSLQTLCSAKSGLHGSHALGLTGNLTTGAHG
jgi:hypothetical protein